MHKLILFFMLSLALARTQHTTNDTDAMLFEIFGVAPQERASVMPYQMSSTIEPPITPIDKFNSNQRCVSDNGEDGECVPLHLCNTNSTITDGSGIIDIRAGGNNCTSYIHVCCVLRDTRKADDSNTPLTGTVKVREGCGWRNPDGIGFYTTLGTAGEAKFGEFPWMVVVLGTNALYRPYRGGQIDTMFVCGGSLIHPSIVLTVAHSVANTKGTKVRAGEWDTHITTKTYPYQDRDVSSIVIHEDFSKRSRNYDVALLFLSTPMELAPNVGVICLPSPYAKAVEGASCLVSGWGRKLCYNLDSYPSILKKLELPVVGRRECQNKLSKTRLCHIDFQIDFQLHSTFMCAGGEPGVDTCKGDGGSPLVCPIADRCHSAKVEQDRYVQNGIVIGRCRHIDVPGFYADVAVLRLWIDNVVEGKGFDPKVYTYY